MRNDLVWPVSIVEHYHLDDAQQRIVDYVEQHDHRCDVLSMRHGNVFRLAIVECEAGAIVGHSIEYAETMRDVRLTLGY